MNWIKDRLLAWLGKKLDGKKTYLAGVGFILIGIAGVVARMYPDAGLPESDWDSISGYFAAGLGAFGLGHKGEKAIAAAGTTATAGIKG